MTRKVTAVLEAEIAKLKVENEQLKEKAEFYDFLRIDIDFTEDKYGRSIEGHYWHNQRGYFNYEYGKSEERPSFETLLKLAVAESKKVG